MRIQKDIGHGGEIAVAEQPFNNATINARGKPHANSVARLTVITSKKPAILSKKYAIDEDGEVVKTTSAQMVEGKAEIVELTGLDGLIETLEGLRSNQALCFGVAAESPVDLVTDKQWQAAGKPSTPIPRTKNHFTFPDGRGVMMFDFDPDDDEVLSCDDLIDRLIDAVPDLADSAFVWWPSSSSFIYKDDVEVNGLRGQRLYLMVKDARDIPRAGKAISEYLWAAGYGRIVVSSSGQKLEKTLFDECVWQGNRLDFAAGAVCEQPLTQRRGKPLIVGGFTEFTDTKTEIPDPSTAIKEKAAGNKQGAKLTAQVEAERAKTVWINERIEAITARNGDQSEEGFMVAETIAERAINGEGLVGDFIINMIEDGETVERSVAELLAEPARYDGLETLDPLEPEYRGFKVVGKLYLMQAKPQLFSQAHGGRSYSLTRYYDRIEVAQGRDVDAVDKTVLILRDHPEFYDFGDVFVKVTDGKMKVLTHDRTVDEIGRVSQFYKTMVNKDGFPRSVDINPPPNICRQFLARGEDRHLKPLKAIVTAPLVRLDGSLIKQSGYDPETQLFIDYDGACNVPEHPSLEQCKTALEVLMKPFRGFPMVRADDRGVLLAALLTAAVRPILGKSPAFGFDAPVQGSGKSKLAECIGVMATGTMPSISPVPSGSGDEERRKSIFASLLAGDRVIVWDNVIGSFNSISLAATITSEMAKGRILGASENANVPNKAIFILTGNNLTLKGDLPRRVLICRIDPGVEKAYARKFTFDPVKLTEKNRFKMVEAALTLIRGWKSREDAFETKAVGAALGSFEEWDSLVRQTVCWIDREIAAGAYGDPVNELNARVNEDPEMEALGDFLRAFHKAFRGRHVFLNEVHGTADPRSEIRIDNDFNFNRELCEAIKELCGGEVPKTSKSLGKFLQYRVDKITGGLVLRKKRDTKTNSTLWLVEQV